MSGTGSTGDGSSPADGSLRPTVDPALGAELFFSLMESEAFNILLEMEKDSTPAKRRFRAAAAALAADKA